METPRKRLKTVSIFVLLYTICTLIELAIQAFFGELSKVPIPAGSPENVLLIAQIVLVSVAFLLLLPSFYIAIKGLKMAENPDSSRTHIVWAAIILVFAILDLAGVIINIVSAGSVVPFISDLGGITLNVIIYIEYIKYAKEVADAN